MFRIAGLFVHLISRVSCIVAMIGMALLVVLFVASIVVRFFGMSVPGLDDLAAVLLAAVFGFGLAAAVAPKEHLSITLAVEKLAPRPRWLLERATEITTVAVVGYLFYGLFNLTSAALRSNQKMLGALPIPKSLPAGLILVGVGLFALALVFQLVRNFTASGSAVDGER